MGFTVIAMVLDGWLLCCEPLMYIGELKLTLGCVVFLFPLQPVGAWLLHCGLLVSRRESWMVTHLAVFLAPPWKGEIDTVMLFTQEVAAKLGTLNAVIPNLSEVT